LEHSKIAPQLSFSNLPLKTPSGQTPQNASFWFSKLASFNACLLVISKLAFWTFPKLPLSCISSEVAFLDFSRLPVGYSPHLPASMLACWLSPNLPSGHFKIASQLLFLALPFGLLKIACWNSPNLPA
jgi:hypothetical protein